MAPSILWSSRLCSNNQVLKLLQEQNSDSAADLALASFRYTSAQDFYRSPAVVNFLFTLGVLSPVAPLLPSPAKLLRKSCAINIDYLNILIGLLGEQKDYQSLVWLLGSLWNSRNYQGNWSPVVTLQLARRYILARYLVDDALKASRLAEDIVYNCRRVNGARHSSTLELFTLVFQLYTGIAQRYQSEKGGQHMANKFYKKSAAVHEILLRVYVDPSFAEFEGGLDNSMSMDGSAYDLDIADSANGSVSDGEHVRQHLQLRKVWLRKGCQQ